MGSYAKVVRPQLFLQSNISSGQATPDVAKLVGVRLVTSSEIPRGGKLSPWAVKALTGGDTVSARHLYKSEFDFIPIFKAWLTMNELPTFHFRDTGIKRRIIPIPFYYVPKNPDPELKRAFRTDPKCQKAILAWAVQGAMRWGNGERVALPQSIVDDRSEYIQQLNPFSQWLRNNFAEIDFDAPRSAMIKTAPLFSHWKNHCRTTRLNISSTGIMGIQAFCTALREEGYIKDSNDNVWNLKPLEATDEPELPTSEKERF